MDYEAIRKEFYKKHTEEELQDILYKLQVTPIANPDIISDIGVDTTPILSSWVDDLLYQAKRINNDLSPAEAMESDECIDKIVEYIKTKPRFFKITKDNINDIPTLTNAIKNIFP